MKVTEHEIMKLLDEVKDPEIPVLSLVDLGVITSVECSDSGIKIEMTPTFVGCPALDIMKTEVEGLLKSKGHNNVLVEINYKQAWTSDRISEKGKTALRKYGLAPPPAAHVFADLEILENINCPHCQGVNTELRSPFGSTLCRAQYYCRECGEAFELFKPL